MKIQFLGTAAAEGWPGLFCKCEYCERARSLGGKNLRTRFQILVNDDLLIDFPPDTYYHAMANNLELGKVSTLLVTHSHSDHFYPMDLGIRGAGFAKTELGNLDIVCNRKAKRLYNISRSFEHFRPAVKKLFRWHVTRPFKHLTLNGYDIYTLPARHALVREKAMFYLIKQGDKAFLQCNDTGYLYDSVFDRLEKLNIKIDMVSLDCTQGAHDTGGNHMGISSCVDIVKRLSAANYTTEQTRYFVTHFSHNGTLLHTELENRLLPHNIQPAYDGLTVTI